MIDIKQAHTTIDSLCPHWNEAFHTELDRLMKSGAVGPDTKLNDVMYTVLMNVADTFRPSKEVNNLRKF